MLEEFVYITGISVMEVHKFRTQHFFHNLGAENVLINWKTRRFYVPHYIGKMPVIRFKFHIFYLIIK